MILVIFMILVTFTIFVC